MLRVPGLPVFSINAMNEFHETILYYTLILNHGYIGFTDYYQLNHYYIESLVIWFRLL